MLQQTQVGRVIEKYEQFLSAFPDFASLAAVFPAKRLWLFVELYLLSAYTVSDPPLSVLIIPEPCLAAVG